MPSTVSLKLTPPYSTLTKYTLKEKLERKQSNVGIEFLKITNSTLYEYKQFNGTTNLFSTFVPPGAYLSYMQKSPIMIEISNYLNAGNITAPTSSIPVKTVISKELMYGGQVDQ